MNCSQCGAEAPAGAAFCSQCGAQLGEGGARMRPGGGSDSANSAPEHDLWSGAYAPMAMMGPFIGAALLTIIGMIAASFAGPVGWMVVGIGAALLFGYLVILLLYRRMSIRYRLTTQRLLRDKGVLTRTGDHLLVVNIDDVTVHQTIFDRMFGLGMIELNTKDKTTPVLKMLGIENPRHVADMIDEVRRTERNRRGLYTMDA
jgi:membrane protein YdbS with pleckstrin-like domain